MLSVGRLTLSGWAAPRLGAVACRCGREALPCLACGVWTLWPPRTLWAVALPDDERERRRTARAHRTPQTAHPHTPVRLRPCLECLLRCCRLPSADRGAGSRHLQELWFVLC
jgi:hypothetical protein